MAAVEMGKANVLSAEANRLAAQLANTRYERWGDQLPGSALQPAGALRGRVGALPGPSQHNTLLNVIQLYRALAGGRQLPAEALSTNPEPSYSAANP